MLGFGCCHKVEYEQHLKEDEHGLKEFDKDEKVAKVNN
jgi:hypothetical protein